MPANLPIPLIALVLVFAVALGGVLYTVVTERERRAVLRRAAGETPAERSGSLLRTRSISSARGVIDQIGDWLAARASMRVGENTEMASRLVHAGFDSPVAPSLFAMLRIASAILFPLVGLLLAPRDDATYFVVCVLIAVTIGLFGPQAGLDRLTGRRQDTIRKGVPDALDLLVVCVEAGVALDAAIQRVAKEMRLVHPILAEELGSMNRRVSAGMPREQALQTLYLRTGLEELRGLASHMIQSEKWGTSIANVLRVYGDQLRRKRKLRAEKMAATASTRMLIPLAIFIFPTIFVVLLGPAGIQVSDMFTNMGQ